ncbi:MAG: integral rane protein [Actinomycetia bacterium]|nr:integral rane protein [Actinomycetes bacterium]
MITVATRLGTAAPPLDPSGAEARSWLRRELLQPDYQQNVVERVLGWLGRLVQRGLDAAAQTPPLSTFAALLVFGLLVAGLTWLASRARRTARRDPEARSVLAAEVVTAAGLRSRAEAALAEGRSRDAVVDGFRALTVRQVERGRLDDAPGATAHEVADLLGSTYPHQRQRVAGTARLFDVVLYGDRPATDDQARDVLALDDELAALR